MKIYKSEKHSYSKYFIVKSIKKKKNKMFENKTNQTESKRSKRYVDGSKD